MGSSVRAAAWNQADFWLPVDTPREAATAAFAVVIAEVPGWPHVVELYPAATDPVAPGLANDNAFGHHRPFLSLAGCVLGSVQVLPALDAPGRANLDERRPFSSHA